MSWTEITDRLLEALKQMRGLQYYPCPDALEFSEQQKIDREFEFETLWRARMDRLVMRCFNEGEEPESPDEYYFVYCRFCAALQMAMGYGRLEEHFDVGSAWTAEEKARWLLVDGWASCGVAFYKDRRQQLLNGFVQGFAYASRNPAITSDTIICVIRPPKT